MDSRLALHYANGQQFQFRWLLFSFILFFRAIDQG